MKTSLLGAVRAFVFTLGLLASANAALVDNGGGLIYDTVLDITWAQPVVRFGNWDEANTWASQLRLGGISGWRLPYVSVAAGAGPFTGTAVDCSTASAAACQDNELGYMFYHNLGGTGSSPLFPTLGYPFWPNYWTGTEFDSRLAWYFDFFAGDQNTGVKDAQNLTWAVHAGNVVPLPNVGYDIAVDFGPAIGFWARMNDANWRKLHPTLSPDLVAVADMDGNGEDDVIGDFTSSVGGLYVKYNLGGWVFLHGGSAEVMAAGDLDGNGQDDLVVDFGPAIGVWARMNDANWRKLHPTLSPDLVAVADMDGNGEDDVIGDFTSSVGGLYVKYNLGGWVFLHGGSAESMTAGDLDNNGQDDLVVDFGAATGFWARMDNESWQKLHHAQSPDVVAIGDVDGDDWGDDVLAGFGDTVGGLWAWVGEWDAYYPYLYLRSWTQQNPNSPDDMVAADVNGNGKDDIVADFSTTAGGIWVKRDEGAWLKLHAASSESLTAGELD